MKQKSRGAIQAEIEIESGIDFVTAIERAKAAGASLDMIGACYGESKQAIHQKLASTCFAWPSSSNPEFQPNAVRC